MVQSGEELEVSLVFERSPQVGSVVGRAEDVVVEPLKGACPVRDGGVTERGVKDFSIRFCALRGVFSCAVSFKRRGGEM
jgi:hypothetical protein